MLVFNYLIENLTKFLKQTIKLNKD